MPAEAELRIIVVSNISDLMPESFNGESLDQD